MLLRPLLAVTLTVAAAGMAGVQGAVAAETDARKYVVVYDEEASLGAARGAIAAAGGTIISENTAIGVATVRSDSARFRTRAAAQGSLAGAVVNQAIGEAPGAQLPKRDDVENVTVAEARLAQRTAAARNSVGGDPLSPLQWDMQMIDATPEGSYRYQRGSRAVRVGIIDTGIDGSHPDIAPNFDRWRSQNFTVDDPSIDGECATDPDGSCEDPGDVDENGHGTHVASTIGSPLNGVGIAGVAPRISLVNLRAGQDSGYFFLGATLDALTYAGDNGIDVVNMSFYTDPWLFNCASNPDDSPAEQREQRLIISATQRAVDYARAHGVTAINALGNGHTDLGDPTVDATSPDYPPGAERERAIDNSCLTIPAETHGVISVSSVGPSKAKADYSNWGIEQTDVSAPGGYARDFFGTDRYLATENRILAAYPESVGRLEDSDEDGIPNIDPAGNPTTPLVVKDGDAYYQWIQGTSMAAPHATGVAALIVAEYGRRDRIYGGLKLNPVRTERILRRTATDTPCPTPPVVDYLDEGRDESYTATCEGDADFNGFYGDGIVNALAAVTGGRWAWPAR